MKVNARSAAVSRIPQRDSGVQQRDMAQAAAMDSPGTPPSKSSATGSGAVIVFCLFAGIVIGFWQGQATIGFLIGTTVGVAIAVGLWMRDRARS